MVRSDLRAMEEQLSGLLVRRTAADGSEYYALEYELVLKMESALMTFEVECKGKSFGMARVEVQEGK